MTVGDKIKSLRKKYNMTQTELGEKVGVKKNAVSKWECGRVEDIPSSTIKALASLFGVSASYLIDDDLESMPSTSNTEILPKNISRLQEMEKIPLYGSIACGAPILAEENIEDYVDLPKHIRADFALTCKGDSMINAGIRDGDVVYIRKQEQVDNGQIAAVRVGEEEATLKRFYFDGQTVTLVAENPAIPPMVYPGEAAAGIHIIGLAVAYTHAIYGNP